MWGSDSTHSELNPQSLLYHWEERVREGGRGFFSSWKPDRRCHSFSYSCDGWFCLLRHAFCLHSSFVTAERRMTWYLSTSATQHERVHSTAPSETRPRQNILVMSQQWQEGLSLVPLNNKLPQKSSDAWCVVHDSCRIRWIRQRASSTTSSRQRDGQHTGQGSEICYSQFCQSSRPLWTKHLRSVETGSAAPQVRGQTRESDRAKVREKFRQPEVCKKEEAGTQDTQV